MTTDIIFSDPAGVVEPAGSYSPRRAHSHWRQSFIDVGTGWDTTRRIVGSNGGRKGRASFSEHRLNSQGSRDGLSGYREAGDVYGGWPVRQRYEIGAEKIFG